MSDVLSLNSLPKPNNVPVEMALIGSLIRNNDIIDDIGNIVSPKDFFHPECREIFSLMVSELTSGNKIDEHLLSSRLTNDEKKVLRHCINNCGNRDNVTDHAKMIVSLSVRREMMAIAFELLSESQNQNLKIEEIIEGVEDRLDRIRDGNREADNEEHVAVVAERILRNACELYQNGKPPGYKTGIVNLDNIVLPMRPGNFILVAGRPAHGKTALAINILEYLANNGTPSALFSYEMTNDEAVERILAGMVKISSDSIADGTMCKDQDLVHKVEKSVFKLKDCKLYIQSPDKLTASNLYLKCKRLVRKYQIQVIAIDYIQLMDGDENRQENERISRISKACKRVAKRLGIVIIGLSQLNRDIEKRENKTPNLADLRASGSLEQDTDVIIFCYREENYVAMEEPAPTDSGWNAWDAKMQAVRGLAQLIVGKQRRGKVGKANVTFNAQETRFH